MVKHSFRWISFVLVVGCMFSLVSFASARSISTSQPRQIAAQATEEATPIDYEADVKIKVGDAAFVSPMDKDNVPYRNVTFSGKANQLVQLTVQKLSGNM